MKIALLTLIALILCTEAVRLEHSAFVLPHLQAAEQKEIQWKSVDVANLTEAQKHVDQVIRSLVGGLRKSNLTAAQVDDDSLSHFVFNYTGSDNKTESITGTVKGDNISFKTSEGLEVSQIINKLTSPWGGEIDLTSVTEKLVKKDKEGRVISSSVVSFTHN